MKLFPDTKKFDPVMPDPRRYSAPYFDPQTGNYCHRPRSPSVRWYQEQPVRVLYEFRGLLKPYYPDAAVMGEDGRVMVVEVKPSFEMYRDTQPKRQNHPVSPRRYSVTPVTCDVQPVLTPSNRALLEGLESLGVSVRMAIWPAAALQHSALLGHSRTMPTWVSHVCYVL